MQKLHREDVMQKMREEKKKKTKQQGLGAMILHSSTSIRRESPPKTDCSTASVGCMSGLFRLFSTHHSNRRLKFLTSGGKKEELSGSVVEVDVDVDRRMISTDSHSPCGPTTPEEAIHSRSSSEAAAERKLLLRALAKCNEDLRELKKIIEELKSNSLSAVDRDDDDVTEIQKVKDDELVTELSSGEEPSPVSVLDEVAWSAHFSQCARERSLQYRNIQQQQQINKIHEEELMGSLPLMGIQQAVKHGNNLSGLPLWCSRAMMEAVEKACSEMAWGEKREQGRIGMALHDQIYRDLMAETVKEIMEIGGINYGQHLKLSYVNGKLHRRGCRRRLSY